MTPSGPDVTTGELARRLDQVDSGLLRVQDKLERLATADNLTSLGVVWQHSLDETERRIQNHQDAQDAAIAELKSWQTWALRIVVGAVLTGVAGLVVVNGGAV